MKQVSDSKQSEQICAQRQSARSIMFINIFLECKVVSSVLFCVFITVIVLIIYGRIINSMTAVIMEQNINTTIIGRKRKEKNFLIL